MGQALTNVLSAAVVKVLRPLLRILLRNGVPYGAFADLAKRVYVDVATQEFGLPGRKQSKSRVSVLTGLSRKEVLRVSRLPAPDDEGTAERYSRAARVISGWVRDRRFADSQGKPAALPFEGSDATFSELVKSYSGDATARAVLDELLRVGAIERGQDGSVRLIARSYIPRTGEAEKIGILGSDVADLVSTIDRNIRNPRDSFFQRKVCYDNLPAEALPELRTQAGERSQELLELLDRWMSERDRDANPSVIGTGRRRAGVGIYYFEDDPGGGESR